MKVDIQILQKMILVFFLPNWRTKHNELIYNSMCVFQYIF